MAGDCPSPREIEALASGEDVASIVREHAAGCDSCRAALSESRENQRFLRKAGAALRQAAGDPRAGTRPSNTDKNAEIEVVPGFSLFEEISRGGQGVVYRAVQNATKRPAAVKMLLAGDLASPRQRARFEREIEIAAALRHPNIITIFESGRTKGGCQYVAMEFVEGLALDKYAGQIFPAPQRRSKQQIDAIVRILASVASAVGAAHTRGVIHRDLKPSNILIDGGGVPRVLDFGLARPAAARSDTTRTQEFVGTPAFAAPEQFVSSALSDARTDVYALGVVLYTLLSGEMPYPRGTTFAEVARHVVATEPAYLSKVAPRISKDLETIVHKCLAKESERRYASAVALEADLQHYLRNEAIDARRDSAWYMLKKAVAQNRRLMAAAVAVLIFVGINGYLLLREMGVARSARGAAEMEQHRAESEAIRSQAIAQIMQAVIPHGNLFADRGKDRIGRATFEGLSGLEAELEYGSYSSQPDLEMALRSTLAGVYANSPQLLGQGEIAIRHALSSRLRAYGPEHIETAVGYHELADVLLSRNRFAESAEACKKALEIRTMRLGSQSAAVGRSHEQLARILTRSGDAVNAVKAGQAAVEILSQTGMAPHDHAAALNTLAEALRSAGDLEGAFPQAEAALRLAVAELPNDDSVLASCLELSARMRGTTDSGVFKGASIDAELLRGLAVRLQQRDPAVSHAETLARLHRVRKALLPPHHPAIRRSLATLASRQFQEALQAIEVGRLYDGRNLVLASRQNLIDSVPLIESEIGVNHIALANVYETIANYSVWCRRYDEAVGYVERSCAVWESQPPESRDKLTYAVTFRWYGWFLCLAQRWPDAERVSREAIDRLSQVVAPEHHAIAIARSQLAWAICEQGDVREALELARKALDTAARSPATPPDQLGWIQFVYGRILLQVGDVREGCARIDDSAYEYWTHRSVYPIDLFLRPAREALQTLGNAEWMADFDCQWGEVLNLWEPQ